MKDPFPLPPPEWLVSAVQPLADALALPTLALHAHEVIFAFCLYTSIQAFVAPFLSARLVPERYKNLSRRTRINWNVHVVSFFQALLISGLSLYVIVFDEERKVLRTRSRWEGRTWEYTGMSGMCQSFALGYFLWDLIMCSWHVDIFGPGMLAHAVSAVSVFALGYRPFIYFYAPIFLLYELSSPFLNIHWFCDKLDLTGSPLQAINGVLLVGTFFGCRLIWGNISSFWVFYDVFHAIYHGPSEMTKLATGAPAHYNSTDLLRIYADEQGQRWAFASGQNVPVWLGLVYLASNLTLNSLNIFWFGKMIETIRKRFDPPFGTKRPGEHEKHDISTNNAQASANKEAREAAEKATGVPVAHGDENHIPRATLADSTSAEVAGHMGVRTRRKA